MTSVFFHQPTATTFTLERDPSLGNNHRHSHEQDVIRSDSGKEFVFTRKVPRLNLDIVFRGLSHKQHADFEQFYFEVVKESGELFNFTSPPMFASAWQVGQTYNGVLLQAGQLIQCGPSDPGFILQAGQYLRIQDSVTLTGVRIVKASFRNQDPLRKATDVSLSITQELPV